MKTPEVFDLINCVLPVIFVFVNVLENMGFCYKYKVSKT